MADWPSFLYPSEEDKERNQEIIRKYMERHDSYPTPQNIQKIKVLIEDAISLIETDPDIAIDHLESALRLL